MSNSHITQVSAARAHERRSSGDATLIDVREAGEHAQGMPEGALAISAGALPARIAQVAPEPEREVILICASGQRSQNAAADLRRQGYSEVASVAGGFQAWRESELPWTRPNPDDPAGNERYARQVRLPEIGAEGQRKLAAARVALVGAGGLGCPAALYLAGAGVGTLGIIDDDVVERSNLHRQVLHNEQRIGQPKVESAKVALEALNPDIRIVAHREKLTSANVERIFSEYDLVLDGCDNFPTRYLVNDACVKLGLFNVSAAVQGFDGQLAVFSPDGPCYRCLFPEPPRPEDAPSCVEAGVLGVVPGLLGTLQALEALKLIVGFGEPLAGRLLIVDTRTSRQRCLRLARDPQCNYCASGNNFPGFVDYTEFCRA